MVLWAGREGRMERANACKQETLSAGIDELFHAYADMVYRLAFLRTRSSADAEDVLQEVFVRCLRSRPHWRDDEHRKAWFIRVTLNCTKSLVTSAWRRHTAPLESAAPDADKDTAKTGGTHTVLVTAGNGGTTDPNGSLTVEDWESVKINFTPNEGYEIQSISVDGKDMGAIESYELTNVTEDHSIIATFVKKAVPTPTPAPATPTPDDGE